MITKSGEETLHCSSCYSVVGHMDWTNQGFRLHKPSLSLSISLASPLHAYSAGKWLTCQLMHAVGSQGARKFSLWSRTSAHALDIWLFSPSITVSSSAAISPGPSRVAKILWKEGELPTNLARLDAKRLTEGEIELREMDLGEVRRCLVSSAALLPETAREFQDWHVALLERFEQEDVW